MNKSNNDLVALFDSAPLTSRFWATVALVYAQAAFEFFDYFLVGYLVAVLAPPWHLTYGQSSIMLLSAGVGAIVGSTVWGRLSDIFGRRKLLLAGTFLYPVAAGLLAVVPDGAWITFSLLRFLIGVGMAGAITAQIPLLVEITPTRHRPAITGAMVVPVSLGVLLAALSAATLLATIGWRGIAALGALPLVLAIAMSFIVPESVRWLLVRGHTDQARRTLAALLRRPVESIALPPRLPGPPPQAPFRDLYRDKVRFWQIAVLWVMMNTVGYCVILWGPTILSLRLGIPVSVAAKYFVYVSLSAICGRILYMFLPLWIGRRRSGELAGYVGAAFLVAMAAFNSGFIDTVPVFLVLLMAMMFFFDGGLSNATPYSAEVFPVELLGRGTGLVQACNGIGKILGPLVLAVIAGAGNLVTPKATSEAILPAFLVLAGCAAAVGLCFTLVPVDRVRVPLSLHAHEDAPTELLIGSRSGLSEERR
ncbi:MAG TPA: MFS transporter [Acetobacteraceae bacterium]|jgi:putative MFS transporter|nr:MFS transporter [Acetobacteraceae bacterium]HTB44943.1 MFS transporter [Acetobacteraceae bacterium]